MAQSGKTGRNRPENRKTPHLKRPTAPRAAVPSSSGPGEKGCPDCGAVLVDKRRHRYGTHRWLVACARCGFEDATGTRSRAVAQRYRTTPAAPQRRGRWRRWRH